MAWQLASKEEVAAFCNYPAAKLRDSWSDMIETLILKHYGKPALQTTYTDEKYDGTGTDTLFLKHVPIVSVSSVVVQEPLWEGYPYNLSTILVYDNYIRLSAGIFPKGKQNIRVTYVAGPSEVDPRLALAECVAMSYLLKYFIGNHGDSGLKFSTAPEVGANQFSPKPGLASKLMQVIKEVVPAKVRIG